MQFRDQPAYSTGSIPAFHELKYGRYQDFLMGKNYLFCRRPRNLLKPLQKTFVYSRVFCQKENSLTAASLVEFLKSRGQLPITPPEMDSTGA